MGYSGFFRCCAVRAALAPSRTSPAAPSLRQASTASQALSNAACRQRSLPGRLRTPRTATRARGLRPEKPSADRGAAKATRTRTSIGSMPILVLVWVACASPRKAEGFFGLPLARVSCARGVEVAGVKNAAEGAFFRACKGGSTSRWRVGPTKVRARRPTPEHRKNP